MEKCDVIKMRGEVVNKPPQKDFLLVDKLPFMILLFILFLHIYFLSILRCEKTNNYEGILNGF